MFVFKQWTFLDCYSACQKQSSQNQNKETENEIL